MHGGGGMSLGNGSWSGGERECMAMFDPIRIIVVTLVAIFSIPTIAFLIAMIILIWRI